MQPQVITTGMSTRQALRDSVINGAADICIRFCELGFDLWMDARALAEAGGPISWVEDNCELDDDQLELVNNHDYEVVADEGGIVGAFCSYGSGWGMCDWSELEEAFNLVDNSHLSEEAILAGIELSIPLDSIEDAYCGEWASDEEFAEELWMDCMEIPAHLVSYIDWAAVARDTMYDHNEENGHYFRANW